MLSDSGSSEPQTSAPEGNSRRSKVAFPQGMRHLLAVATLFVILGAGNVIVGRSRASDYTAVLSKSASPSAIVDPHPSKRYRDESVHIRRVRSRIAFYEMVDLGGRCFLAVAGILFLASLIPLRSGERNTPKQLL